MNHPPIFSARSARSSFVLLLAAGAVFSSSACSSGNAEKAWSQLAACLKGPQPAQEPLARARQLRSFQLADPLNQAKDAWPTRCAVYADDLNEALGAGAESAILKRKLRERLSCGDAKGSCTVRNDPTLTSTIIELGDAAQSIGLKTVAVEGIAAPKTGPEPQLDKNTWKSFSDKALSTVGPVLAPDGRAFLLLKAETGRTRPIGCELPPGFGKLSCADTNPQVPELPPQNMEILYGPEGLYAAGVTENGLTGYNLKTGATTEVRGTSGHLVQHGLAVEAAGEEKAPANKAAAKSAKPSKSLGDKFGKPAAGAKGAKAPEPGFVALELERGKASKPEALSANKPTNLPIQLGNQAFWLESSESGVEFVSRALDKHRLRPAVRIKGSFSGAFHTCETPDGFAVATWAPHAGEHAAKPTAGSNQTQFALTIFRNGSWSKALETTLPFDRALESNLVCTKTGVSLVWAQTASGAAQVSRLDCTLDGCKTSTEKLPNIDAKWWWAVGPVGDQVAILWRSGLGETRVRVAPLNGLGNAKETILFDAPDFGGPNATKLTPLFSEQGALFVFRDERPVALQVSPNGTIQVLSRS